MKSYIMIVVAAFILSSCGNAGSDSDHETTTGSDTTKASGRQSTNETNGAGSGGNVNTSGNNAGGTTNANGNVPTGGDTAGHSNSSTTPGTTNGTSTSSTVTIDSNNSTRLQKSSYNKINGNSKTSSGIRKDSTVHHN